MDTDDIGDISSFATQPHEKGLLTFYQEQWTKFPSHQSQPLTSTINLSKHEHSKTVQVKNQKHKVSTSYHESLKLPILLVKKKPKPTEIKEIPKISEKPFRLTEKAEPLNLPVLSKTKERKKVRENQIKSIEAATLKRVPFKERVKQRKILQSIHIQNYPFEDQQDQELAVNKSKRQAQGMRRKKGSPFKGFHRQNVSVSVFELDKEFLSQISKQASKILGQTMNKYEKYSSTKNVAKYIFPIISPRLISLKKGVQELKNTGSDNNLNTIQRKTYQKPCRNSHIAQHNPDHFN